MHDLTQGSIPRHIIRMAMPIAIGMLFQTLYYLIDLYFVSRLGGAAIAGVSAAGNMQFIVMAVTQVLGIGTMVLIAHAAGRKDQADANLVFNQSLLLAAIAGALVLIAGYTLGPMYLRTLAADDATYTAGTQYLFWFLPALGLQFALISMGSALRGTGIAKPTMVVQVVTVVLNAILAPILIAGWGTGRPLGVAGAGIASSIAVAIAVVTMILYFVRLEHYVGFDAAQFRAHFPTWGRVLRIGVPAGGEFALMFLSMGVIYWIIRDFGAAAQAGFGVGSRLMQSIFLPAMAVAFAAAPIAGQNFAAGKLDRARETFWEAAKIGSILMGSMTLFAHWQPEWLIRLFAADETTVAVAVDFLRTISWNFILSGLIFTCSGIFQALGNTVPSVISGAVRLVVFAAVAIFVSRRPGFTLQHIWYVSVLSTTIQAVLTLWLLKWTADKAMRRAAEGTPALGQPFARSA
ncbi:MAG: MATE family efflux transporter [Gemmatimonadaceae bacterium]|nr:MATE family efflux transporter [Gemmatimonadaceae bacterium]